MPVTRRASTKAEIRSSGFTGAAEAGADVAGCVAGACALTAGTAPALPAGGGAETVVMELGSLALAIEGIAGAGELVAAAAGLSAGLGIVVVEIVAGWDDSPGAGAGVAGEFAATSGAGMGVAGAFPGRAAGEVVVLGVAAVVAGADGFRSRKIVATTEITTSAAAPPPINTTLCALRGWPRFAMGVPPGMGGASAGEPSWRAFCAFLRASLMRLMSAGQDA